jgi:hypothetical protein
MKTKDYLRQYFPVITIALVLIASTLEAVAEDHHKGGKREKESDHGRQEYRQPSRYDEQTANNDWLDREDRDRDDRNQEYRNNRNEYQPVYSKKNYHAHLNYYNHPQHGRVYIRFDHNPIVFKTQYGNYYYSENNFYRYHDGIGYCAAEPPRNQYFRYLPVECRKVYINGQMFFRNGDLFFELLPRGYVLVPSPFEIRFSARF